MHEFSVEYFIVSDDEKSMKLSSLNEKDMEKWKKDTESRALSEYYNTRIKISDIKI